MNRTKLLSHSLLVVYIGLLVWIVLFKFSLDWSSMLAYPERSLNVIPFADTSQTRLIDFTSNLRDRIYNVLIFVPFGLLLSINSKRLTMGQKLAIMFGFSLTVEVIQYVLGIGIADVTDVITNTAGGLIGLVVYDWLSRYVESHELDRSIVAIGLAVLVAGCLLLGVWLSQRVQYRQHPSRMPQPAEPKSHYGY